MFKEKVACAFKGMRRIKYCCNTLIAKLDKRRLFRNTQLIQGLEIVGTHANTVATITSSAL
jgi:hypothetical protein